MPRRCMPIALPDGTTGFICYTELAHRCKCGKLATLRCDYPVTRRGTSKPGTCDRWICPSCSTSLGNDRDLCPPHARYAAELAEQQALPGVK